MNEYSYDLEIGKIPFPLDFVDMWKTPCGQVSPFFPACGQALIFSTSPVDAFFLQPQRVSHLFHKIFPYGYYC